MKHSDNILDLGGKDAIEKLKELVDHNSICMFGTVESGELRVRPMATQEVDEDGNLWFLSGKESQKNSDIEEDSRVQIFFSNTSDSEFLSITGDAQIVVDRNRLEELWNPIAKAWFKQGKDDPSITLIKVSPASSYYWDTRHGRMVSLIKIATAAVTGQSINEGVQGRITP